MLKNLHKTAASFALFLIASFWLSTVMVELFATKQSIVFVKTAIAYAIPLLVISMLVTGLTGKGLARHCKNETFVQRKQKRMKVVALLGVFILIPSAYVLQHLATQQDFSFCFYLVQGFELLAGAINLTLLALNMKESIKSH